MSRYPHFTHPLLPGLFLAILLLALCLPTLSLAVQSLDNERSLVQPDGTVLRVTVKGDEFQHWVEDTASRKTLLKNPHNGYWEYAEMTNDGTLTPSGLRVDPAGIAIPRQIPNELKPPRNAALKTYQQELLQDILLQRRAQAAPAGGPQLAAGDWTPSPLAGSRKVLVVLVNFANRELITTPQNWYQTIFDTTPGVKSVRNYYTDNSFGSLTVLPVTHTQNDGLTPGIVEVTIAAQHPDNADPTYAVESAWINQALAQAATYVNFAQLDTNLNGVLDLAEVSVYFILAGYDASGSSQRPYIWAHAWGGDGVSAGGKALKHWALNGELNDADNQHPMGVIAHELGHSLCGLPDLYDTTYTNAGMGSFSLMAGGSWGNDVGEESGVTPVVLDAWSRIYLGWTTPQTSSGTLNLHHALYDRYSVIKLVNPAVKSNEYFLAENRYPTGWDRGLRGKTNFGSGWSGGLLITHIDITAGTKGSNDLNDYVSGGHQGVVPEQASTTGCDMIGGTCRGSATTLFYSGNKTTFDNASSPNSRYYNGNYSNFSLTGISIPGDPMIVTAGNPATDLLCALPDAISVPATSVSSSYTVNWNASPTAGATYVLQEATNAAFTTGVRTAYNGSATSADISGRSKGITYYYRVRATKNGYQPSAWRPADNGCLVGTVCGVPTSLTVPTNDADGNYNVSWGTSVTGGVTYELQEATDVAFTTGLRLAYTGTATSVNISDRNTSKKYFYRVRATSAGYTSSGWRKAANPCAVKFNTVAPAIFSVPANPSIGSYTITWAASTTTGVTYVLEQATNPTFTLGRSVVYTGTATSKQITGRAIGSVFYYRIKATKAGYNPSPWVVAATPCKIGIPCAEPTGITVPGSDPDGNYAVSWGASPTSGVTYTVEEATNTTFTTGLRVVYSGTGLMVNITGRSRVATYYYRVKATRSGYVRSDWVLSANGCIVSDSYEPDNLSSQAKTLYLGTTQSRSFNPIDDFDWIRISCNVGGYHEIFTTGTTDTYVDIYDSTGTNWLNSVDDLSDSNRNFGFILDCTTGSGTLLLQTSEYSGLRGLYNITYRNYTGTVGTASRIIKP